MIDLEKPKSKAIGILRGEPMSEPAGGGDLEIVEHDDRSGWGLVHGQKKRVLPFRRIRRAIDENQLRALEALE